VSPWGEFIVAACLIVAVIGAVVPILPGALLAWITVLVWAWVEGTPAAWITLALVTVVLVAGQALKYLIPGRSLRRDQVPNAVLVVGAIGGLVGFFVLPLVGLFIGFIAGVWAATIVNNRTWRGSWPDTRTALRAAGTSILIETTSVILAAGLWVGGAVASSP
jgi:uncharacterized protein YqgC (DUF456 family)